MKTVFCIFFVNLFCLIVAAQSKPVLLADISPDWEDVSEIVNHKVLDAVIYEFEKDARGLLAVRICSSDPLPVAFASSHQLRFFASVTIPRRLKSFRELRFLRENEADFYILRNPKGCNSSNKKFHTEYWYVSSSADMPEFIEVRKADTILVENLTSSFERTERDILGEDNKAGLVADSAVYEKVISSAIERLLKNKTAYLLVEGFTERRNTKTFQTKILQLKRELSRASIGDHRIFIKRKQYNGDSKDDPKEIYPNITIVYQEPKKL